MYNHIEMASASDPSAVYLSVPWWSIPRTKLLMETQLESYLLNNHTFINCNILILFISIMVLYDLYDIYVYILHTISISLSTNIGGERMSRCKLAMFEVQRLEDSFLELVLSFHRGFRAPHWGHWICTINTSAAETSHSPVHYYAEAPLIYIL